MSEIKQAIRALVGKTENPLSVATIKSVDWAKRECTVELPDGREVEEVRLRAVADESDKGIAFKPKEDSLVLLGAIDGDWVILLYTEIETVELIMPDVELIIEEGKVKVQAKEWEFNGGDNKGLAIVGKIAERFNDIEKALTEIKSVFASHTHLCAAPGSASDKVLSPFTYSVPNSTGSDFENNKITH